MNEIPTSFQVKNGMTGMFWGILFKVFKHVHSEKEVRAVIGMNSQHYLWKEKSYFRSIVYRKFVFKWSVFYKPEGIKVSNKGKTAKVVRECDNGAFIIIIHDRKITNGVITISIKVMRMYTFTLLCVRPLIFQIQTVI